ncbi:TolC family protein [Parapedobacter tibetensis]|uniref:TolC family protein n=1 Tax=Parapedobacter tibetensis TaxID=2972951 RepID=UPI00214DE8DA|nr:TolC family protein [Parapedobacter tibetensis]
MKARCLYLPFFSAMLGIPGIASAQEWTLESCLQYGLQHSRELLVAEKESEVAEVGQRKAISALLPEVDGTAGLDHYWKIPVQVFPGELLGQPEGTFVPVRLGTPWTGTFGAEGRLPIVDAQAWGEIKMAALKQQAAQERQQNLDKTLVRNIRMAFYHTSLGMETIQLTESRLERVSEMHGLISRLFKSGLTDKIAFNQSLTLLKDREEAALAAKSDSDAALLDLKFWMGYPLDSVLTINPGTLGTYSAMSDAFDPSLLPEYGNRRLQADLATQQWKNTKKALLPTLALTAGYSKMGFGSSLDFIGESTWFASGYVGLQLRVPLFSMAKMAHNPKEQRLRAETAAIEFEQYQQSEQKRYMEERLQLNKSLTRVRIQEERMALAQENEVLAAQKLEKGIIDMLELKDVQQELDQVHTQLNQAKLEYFRHQVTIQYLQNQQ